MGNESAGPWGNSSCSKSTKPMRARRRDLVRNRKGIVSRRTTRSRRARDLGGHLERAVRENFHVPTYTLRLIMQMQCSTNVPSAN
jgi:hypothetical protein